MKNWSDLSWKEKMDIKNGCVNPYSYLIDYTYDVKQKVHEGEKQKERSKRR